MKQLSNKEFKFFLRTKNINKVKFAEILGYTPYGSTKYYRDPKLLNLHELEKLRAYCKCTMENLMDVIKHPKKWKPARATKEALTK